VRYDGRPDADLLPLVRALAMGTKDLSLAKLRPGVIEHALARGFGPVLAHVGAGDVVDPVFADRIRSANLAARVLTFEKLSAIEEVLAAAEALGCRVALLKGAATAIRYYPSPHLRTMGDVDLLVDEGARDALAARLRFRGFRQCSVPSAVLPPTKHHDEPIRDPKSGVWIDLHTSLHPPQYPLASLGRFSPAALGARFSPVTIGNHTAYAMCHELQLVYTSARWSEAFDSQRGVYPLLDATLLLQKHGEALDWDQIKGMVHGSWAVTALRLMLSLLAKWRLAPVPGDTLDWLAAHDRHANRLSIGLLHRLIARFVIGNPPAGAVMSEGTVSLIWSALLRPAGPSGNLLRVPYYVAFPPGTVDRFSPARAARRIGTVIRRALRTAS
jgi:hypothetical protein